MSEEKCALVAELVQVLDMVRQLEAHMLVAAQQQQQGGEQRCRALVSTMRASIDRAVHMAMSCCAARPAAAPGQQPESPPSGGDGSPRSAGSDDQAADFGGRGNAAGQQLCKKSRKTLPKVSTQVRVSSVQDVGPLDDGLSWRKYGQKDILGAKYPRAYFRCTHRYTQSCHASKQVQRTDADPLLFDVVYHGAHTCAQAHHRGQDAAAAHPTNYQRARPPAGAGAAASAAAEPALPFPLPAALTSNRPAAGADEATSSRFASGCVAASPFVCTATPSECLQVSSSYAVGEMEFMFPLDTADFLENPASYF